MTKIYISHSNQDKELAIEITQGLKEFGHDIFIDSENIHPGDDWRSALSNALKQSDVFLVLLTEHSANSQFVLSEIGAARAYIDSASNIKLFIPIVFDNISIPFSVRDIQVVLGDRKDVTNAIIKVEEAIRSFYGRKIAAEEKREERIEKIERSASKYIEETIQGLKKREQYLASKAEVWNFIGWGSLISGVVASIGLVILGIYIPLTPNATWVEIVFLAFKGLIIIALLIASSKYAFSLAKSYMSESLKNADRIHAISFGKFFLQAFGENIDIKEVKEVFQHWNISTPSSFAELDSDKFDPKIIQAVLSIADVIKKDEDKTKKS